jgi:hypothetical protein
MRRIIEIVVSEEGKRELVGLKPDLQGSFGWALAYARVTDLYWGGGYPDPLSARPRIRRVMGVDQR